MITFIFKQKMIQDKFLCTGSITFIETIIFVYGNIIVSSFSHQLLNRLDRNNTNAMEQNTALVAFVTDGTVQLHSMSVNQWCNFRVAGSVRITIDILYSLSDNLFKMDISICFLCCLISFWYITSLHTTSLIIFEL